MDIELLYVPDCPHRGDARRHLAAALAETGVTAVVHERKIESPEDAARLRMHGSPTVRIDGRDAFADPSDRPSLSCRLYRGDHGVAGAPTVAQLVAVLTAQSR
jgi:hypothetical protein